MHKLGHLGGRQASRTSSRANLGPHEAPALGQTLFGIHEHPVLESSKAFSALRPGLDHVGFGIANRAQLEQWQSRHDELGIAYGGIVDAPYGSGLSFRDPDNIALGLFARPAEAGRPGGGCTI